VIRRTILTFNGQIW